MKETVIRVRQIVSADSNDTVFYDHCIKITDNLITDIFPYSEEIIGVFRGEYIDASDKTLIPGFVQTHIHLCQTLFRGLADDLQLLDWLQLYIFPYENAHDKNSLRASAQLGINELFLGGTTTLLDMGTLNHQEIIFDELLKSGIRAYAGKCMIDLNDLFPEFKSSTQDELKETYELAKEFHRQNKGLVQYGFAPRFVLSCSEKLLRETKGMMKDFPGSIFHTHSSENKEEIRAVKQLHNKENIEYFDSIGVLDDHTVLAHCIHLNDNEIQLMKKNNSRISHCPSSNLKLASGIANIPRYLNENISVSLGADGAPCNNQLSIFTEMRLASLIQKPIHGAEIMNAKTVFRLATIEGAKALHLEKEIGSIELGKKADLVLLDLNKSCLSLGQEAASIYSNIVYSGDKSIIDSVIVDGKWKVRNQKSVLYDQEDLTNYGREELNKLLKRVG
ncbi:MAG: amidohydrolase family protein [Ignavibacteriaceae bacterium]